MRRRKPRRRLPAIERVRDWVRVDEARLFLLLAAGGLAGVLIGWILHQLRGP